MLKPLPDPGASDAAQQGAESSDAPDARVTPQARLPRSLWRQPGLLLSLAYLCTSAIGLWANYWYYHPFGVNILQFMQVSDFLAAGLQDPAYFGLVICGGLLSWLLSWPKRWQGAERWRRRWWGRVLFPQWHLGMMRRVGLGAPSVGAMIGMVWMAMWLIMGYVQNRATGVLAGEGRRVSVVVGADTRQGLCADPRLIGTTSQYVFLYCGEPRSVEIMPIENIGRISVAVVRMVPVENDAK